MDETKDPEDVYRVWLPAHRKVIITVKADANVDLAIWGPKTKTVFERGAAQRRDLLAYSNRPRTRAQRIVLQGKRVRNAYGYVDVYLPPRLADAAYTLAISTH
jgi:hypothetical protein